MNSEPPPPPPGRVRRSRSLKVFVIRNGEIVGPQSWDEVRRKLVGGYFGLRDYAWHSRLTHWVRLEAFGEARKVTSAEKYEMPPPPRGVKLRSHEPRTARREPPAIKPGLARRFLRRMLGKREVRETRILRRLSGGHLEGAALAPGQVVSLFCRTPAGRGHSVRLPGLIRMRLDGFEEMNRIKSIHLYNEDEAPPALLTRLGETHQEREDARKRRGWAMLRLVCDTGCELTALFDRAAMGEAGTMPDEGDAADEETLPVHLADPSDPSDPDA